jgi:hypothetical protein
MEDRRREAGMAGEREPERIESSFRYGSAIMIGVLTGFSLAFLTAWAANPIPWGWKDIPALAPLVVGVILQLVAVWRLLDPRSLERIRYERAIRYFMAGMILVGIGVALGITVDFIVVSDHFMAPASSGGAH